MIAGRDPQGDRERQQRALSEISRVFLEYQGTDEVFPLRQAASLIASAFPFEIWCAIRLVGPDMMLREVAAFHPVPEKHALASKLAEVAQPLPWFDKPAIPNALLKPEPLLLEDVSEEMLRAGVQVGAAALEIILALRPRSVIIAPMMHGSEPLGTVVVSSTDPAAKLTRQDLDFLVAVNDRAALVIRNARLARSLAEERERLSRARQDAERRTARVSAFIAASPSGLAFFDAEHRVQLLSPSMATLFKELPTQGAALGDALDVLLTGVTDSARLRRDLYATLTERRPAELIELELLDPMRALRCRTVPVWGTGGTYEGRFCIFEDVTHEHELDRQRMEFLNIAAHELRTPLTPLSMHLQTFEHRLARGQQPDPAMITRARRQVDRLTGLIDDLLDTSRLESGQLEIHREPVRIDELVREVVVDFRSAHTRHEVVLVEVPDRLVVEGDAGRLEQVILNLLENAAKYSPDSGVITVRLQATTRDVSIAVTDSGLGIPAADQPRVFERFYRAQDTAARGFGGMGIGLFIAHEIVRRHGGWIDLKSAPQVGSTFTVHLPRPTHGDLKGRPRVLVAEDDEAILEAMATFLREEGYEVECVRDGAAALQSLSRGMPAVIVLDLMMPVLDGWSFLSRLEADHIAPDVPIIVVSADRTSRLQGLQPRVAAALRKPFNLEELERTIQGVLHPEATS